MSSSIRIRELLKSHKISLKNGQRDPDDRHFITDDQFAQFAEMYGMPFPDEIKYFYSRIGVKEENELTRSIASALDTRWLKGRLLLQIGPKLAVKIIETYQSLSEKEKIQVIKDTELGESDQILTYYPTIEEYLLSAVIERFDPEEKKFPNEFINHLVSDYWNSNEVIYSFVTWAHCGGCGSIILNTDRKGYEGGQMFGHYPKVSYKGKEYEYFANYWGDREKHHLEQYEDYLAGVLNE